MCGSFETLKKIGVLKETNFRDTPTHLSKTSIRFKYFLQIGRGRSWENVLCTLPITISYYIHLNCLGRKCLSKLPTVRDRSLLFAAQQLHGWDLPVRTGMPDDTGYSSCQSSFLSPVRLSWGLPQGPAIFLKPTKQSSLHSKPISESYF